MRSDSAWQALCAMLSTAWISCSRSPRNSGIDVSYSRTTCRPLGNSARISERTRSHTSWMLTSPTTCGPAVRRQQAVHQRLQAIGLVDDDLGVFLQVARLDLHLQQLRRAADAAQRILDLVREVADQLLVGLRLVDQPLFAILPGLRLQRQQFDDDLARPVGLRHHHVHRHRLAVVLAQQPGVVAQRGELVAAARLPARSAGCAAR